MLKEHPNIHNIYYINILLLLYDKTHIFHGIICLNGKRSISLVRVV